MFCDFLIEIQFLILLLVIITALAGLRGWGGVVSQHALQLVSQHALQVSEGLSRPTPMEEVEGSDHGGSPGPHPGGGCIPECTEADTPPHGRLLPQTVRILLECILVENDSAHPANSDEL